MRACYFSTYFNPFTCSPVFQGTLKEKTVENLEKYVVRDVSTHINILREHTGTTTSKPDEKLTFTLRLCLYACTNALYMTMAL